MKVIDNVVGKNDLINMVNRFITTPSVPYYLTNNAAGTGHADNLDSWQFVHNVMQDTNILDEKSFLTLRPLLKVIDPYVIIRLKINITHRTSEVVENGVHTDSQVPPDGVNVKSSVFYLNTNDGYTSFETGEKVESLENRLVLFDALEKHAGSTCTNAKYRAVVNCVYI